MNTDSWTPSVEHPLVEHPLVERLDEHPDHEPPFGLSTHIATMVQSLALNNIYEKHLEA